MAKRKTKSEVEHLRGVIKQLQKRIKRNEKREHIYEDLEIKEAEILLKEEMDERKQFVTHQIPSCPKCQSELDIIDGAKVKVYICQGCNYRSSSKNYKN